MSEERRLMCVLAHPDDETLGAGGVLARYAAEGVEIYLLTATGGGQGWPGAPEAYPGQEELAQLRMGELQEAAEVLGIKEVAWGGYADGELDKVPPAEVIALIVAYLREVRPQVVVTFDPYGIYGHPDHIAICQLATAAVLRAADPAYEAPGEPHRVMKLYYLAETQDELEAYEAIAGELAMEIDGVRRKSEGWPPWALTTWIDTSDFCDQVWAAIACHRTQLPSLAALFDLAPEERCALWQKQGFYRVFSLVNGGRERETDLFAGLD